MKFTKLHGCGNGYIYVNLFEEQLENPAEMAIKVSDHHFGIGSDGLITIGPSDVADFAMRIYNADGSEAEMCGNGIRCVGKYVYDHGMTDKTDITVESGAGIKYLKLNVVDGKVDTVCVDMGEPIFAPEEIPVMAGSNPVIDEPIRVGDREWKMTCVSMGNPHAVVFVDEVKDFPLEKYGPLFENHERFPNRTNTEFVEIIDRNNVFMRVWERGTGETLACGTGCCATAVACVLNGRTDRHVTVRVLGGEVIIDWDEKTGHVFMTGPAEFVFEGEIEY
jgi:diaminopimelate epimerase